MSKKPSKKPPRLTNSAPLVPEMHGVIDDIKALIPGVVITVDGKVCGTEADIAKNEHNRSVRLNAMYESLQADLKATQDPIKLGKLTRKLVKWLKIDLPELFSKFTDPELTLCKNAWVCKSEILFSKNPQAYLLAELQEAFDETEIGERKKDLPPMIKKIATLSDAEAWFLGCAILLATMVDSLFPEDFKEHNWADRWLKTHVEDLGCGLVGCFEFDDLLRKTSPGTKAEWMALRVGFSTKMHAEQAARKAARLQRN